MHLSLTLLLALSTTAALTLPLPTITNITYWGSACPTSGLTFTLPSNTTTPTNSTASPLTFTLSNFLPNFGSFGSSLRMCNAVAFIAVKTGYKVIVNQNGTVAQGNAEVPEGARLYFRASWAFAENMGVQSVGMFDTPGPLAGAFAHLLTPVEGSDQGVVSGCAGGESELDIEFQARAVNETSEAFANEVEASWTLTTDVEVVRC